MRVTWHWKALYDLDAIEGFIERDNPLAARQMERRIKQAVFMLAAHPMIGRSGRVPRTRELVVPGTPYIVAYTITKSGITVLTVLHGARKWPESI